jgi:hypothetical protein
MLSFANSIMVVIAFFFVFSIVVAIIFATQSDNSAAVFFYYVMLLFMIPFALIAAILCTTPYLSIHTSTYLGWSLSVSQQILGGIMIAYFLAILLAATQMNYTSLYIIGVALVSSLCLSSLWRIKRIMSDQDNKPEHVFIVGMQVSMLFLLTISGTIGLYTNKDSNIPMQTQV